MKLRSRWWPEGDRAGIADRREPPVTDGRLARLLLGRRPLSSVAYATAEMVGVLLRAAVLAAFSLSVPISTVIIGLQLAAGRVVSPDQPFLPERRRRLHRHPG